MFVLSLLLASAGGEVAFFTAVLFPSTAAIFGTDPEPPSRCGNTVASVVVVPSGGFGPPDRALACVAPVTSAGVPGGFAPPARAAACAAACAA